ncbi:hypothetical protein SLEP1_g48014 [Rubroshorea leprosula]|uniref:C2 domain-containing protein n=1 Tax=Rubroshorea leprosula TaxID=152421 RepID=A0AAV5LU49_9ROSI|nr:hypothetical protein SLEP1_g48014 [Rubroshorea leprosula]
MEHRHLDINLISANGLRNVNRLHKMSVYAVVTINGDAQTEQKTRVDEHCGSNPVWKKCSMTFNVDDAAALVIRLVSDRRRHLFPDKDIGKVVVSIQELLASKEEFFVREVQLPDGQPQGTLILNFKIR